MTITVELPLETGERQGTGSTGHPEFAGECWSAQQADPIASAYLSPSRNQVNVDALWALVDPG